MPNAIYGRITVSRRGRPMSAQMKIPRNGRGYTPVRPYEGNATTM